VKAKNYSINFNKSAFLLLVNSLTPLIDTLTHIFYQLQKGKNDYKN